MTANKKLSRLGILNLRPLKAAKVSEISEATSTAGVSREDQIHFHIGNPVEDKRLNELYFRLIHNENLQQDNGELPENLENQTALRKKFLMDAVVQCTSYMPRGGYNTKS